MPVSAAGDTTLRLGALLVTDSVRLVKAAENLAEMTAFAVCEPEI